MQSVVTAQALLPQLMRYYVLDSSHLGLNICRYILISFSYFLCLRISSWPRHFYCLDLTIVAFFWTRPKSFKISRLVHFVFIIFVIKVKVILISRNLKRSLTKCNYYCNFDKSKLYFHIVLKKYYSYIKQGNAIQKQIIFCIL